MEKNNNNAKDFDFEEANAASKEFQVWKSKKNKTRFKSLLVSIILLTIGFFNLKVNDFDFNSISFLSILFGFLFFVLGVKLKSNLEAYNAHMKNIKALEEKSKLNKKIQQGREKKKSDEVLLQKKVEINAKNIEKIKYEERIKKRLATLEIAMEQVNEISKINVVKLVEFKNFVTENESNIIEKGGDEKLFQFLKIDLFLQDYRSKIVADINEIGLIYNKKEIENAIIEDEKMDKSTLEYSVQNASNFLNVLNGKTDNSFNFKINTLFKIASTFKPTINNQIDTLCFYNSLAFAMLIAFLDNKKIRFFEIYSAFDELGVFDSSWQKNVAGKLESIDMRLANLNNQMIELNDTFIRLAESSEEIARELKQGFKDVNSSIDAGNILSAITTYEVYKINKNTKRF